MFMMNTSYEIPQTIPAKYYEYQKENSVFP